MYYGYIAPHHKDQLGKLRSQSPMGSKQSYLSTRFLTLKTNQFSVEENNHLLELVNERREVAMVKTAHYQQKLR